MNNREIVNEKISLFWKDTEEYVELTKEAQKDLDIDYICDSISNDKQEQKWIKEMMIKVTSDEDTIVYRSEIFEDLMMNKEMMNELDQLIRELRILDNFNSIKMVTMDYSSVWQLINRLKELYSYIVCIEKIKNIFNGIDVQSEGLRRLKASVNKVYDGSGFEYLKQDINRLTEDVSRMKSLTLGVNLDTNLNPSEVKLVSINDTVYRDKENSLLMSFANCFAGGFANSVVKGNKREIDPLMNALTRRVEELLNVTVNDLKSTLNKYVDVSGYEIIKLLPELVFYIRFAQMTMCIRNMGLPISRAQIETEEKRMLDVKDYYNIKLALYSMNHDQTVITNDIYFNNRCRQIILTGPNRGGKTILTQGVGLWFLFAQNGLYVPGIKAHFSPTDNIYTHFPADENHTVELGRLGEEIQRIYQIIQNATSKSLILLNESLATTSFNEGLYIAKDVVKALNYMGARVIYNTHMHELANQLNELNCNDNEISSIVSMVMGIEGSERSYKITISPPAGISYAEDIAKKYGVSFIQMKKEIDEKRKPMHTIL